MWSNKENEEEWLRIPPLTRKEKNDTTKETPRA